MMPSSSPIINLIAWGPITSLLDCIEIRGAEESGSTALTAIVSNQLLCFAHCGDCRGVLYRDGQILQVTREHSPESYDEKQRIECLGGRIIAIRSDTPRVMGVLNMTRSIGDFGLKPYIIPNPEVPITKSPSEKSIR